MKEVLTIQAGPYANWVGAHFWNMQVEDPVEGEAAGEQKDGQEGGRQPPQTRFRRRSKVLTEAGTPRLLLFDMAQEIDPFRGPYYQHNQPQQPPTARELEKEKAALPWDGAIEVHHLAPPATRPRQQPSAQAQGNASSSSFFPTPNCWSAAWRGAPLDVARNCVVVQEYEDDSANEASGGWGPGRGGDQLHRLLEDCDAPQGLHLLLDLARPALGLGVSAAEEFVEEVGGGALACYAYHTHLPTASREQDARRVADAALGIKTLLEAGALLIPSAMDAVQPSSPPSNRGEGVVVDAYRSSALQATALEAVSGVYREEEEGSDVGRCHMREWVRGIRSGASSLAAVELGLPFPRTQQAGEVITTRRALDHLLRPRADEGTSNNNRSSSSSATLPNTGFLGHLVSLAPRARMTGTANVKGSSKQESDDPFRRRRLTALASVYGLPLPVHAVHGSLDDALKYYPWFQPHLNFVSSTRLPVHRPPFPLPFLCPGQEQRVADSKGASCFSLIGCTSAVAPFLEEIASTFAARGPGLRQRLLEERGLLSEDLGEVDAMLADLLESGVPRELEAES